MRIQQNSSFLVDVVRNAANGEICPAAFQRNYVWRAPDVEALWNSILKHWPIGSFLLWNPSRDTDLSNLGRGRLGPIQAEPTLYPSLVLDGQNRLASMAWSLMDPDVGPPDADNYSVAERETWLSGNTLVADAGERRFRFVPTEESRTGRRIPAGLLVESPRAWKYMRAREKDGNPIGDADLDWMLNDCDRAIREARATVTVMHDATPEEALEAFRHIARTGVPMSDEDFEASISWAMPGNPAPGMR